MKINISKTCDLVECSNHNLNSSLRISRPSQFILVFNWVEYEPAKSGDYIYPLWANVLGWIIALFPVFIILVMMVIKYVTCDVKGSFTEVTQVGCKSRRRTM